MPDLFFERHVPHRPERMYALVNDLESYPRFIPNCRSMAVSRDRGTAPDVRLARMTIKFGVKEPNCSRASVSKSSGRPS